MKLTVTTIGAGLLVAGLAALGVSGPARAAAQPSVPATVSTMNGSVASFVRTAPVTGVVPATERLTVEVWLQPRTAAATAFAQAVSTPGSAGFHHYLSPDSYAARFGATTADARTVESWLRAQGFTGVAADAGRSYVQATATAATIDRAFDVQLKRYRASATVNAGQYALRSNDRPVSLPATVARLVLGVTGLDNAAPASTAASPATTAACSVYFGQHQQGGLPKYLGRTSFPTQVCGYSARQLRAVYGANLTSTGTGQTIALTEMGSLDPDDLLTLEDYAKATGLPAPSAKRFAERSFGPSCSTPPARPANANGPDDEEQMDIEAAYLMAPGASELVATGTPCGDSDPMTNSLLNAVQGVLTGSGHHPLASIVSNSWELDVDTASVVKVEHAQLLQAAAEGVGMYFASGDDSGVNSPSDDPYAIAVGGTTLGITKTRSRLFETGWSTGSVALEAGKWVGEGEAGAAGGGPSTTWKQPAYQQGVVPAVLAKVPGQSGAYRSVPDLSADADPDTPMAVGVLNTSGKKPVFSFSPNAGTSLATPLVAGMVAAAQQGAKTTFGFLNPVLYKLAGTSALYDELPFTAATPPAWRGIWCGTDACLSTGLNLFDVQSTDKGKGFTGQVTRKGYDNMTGVGTPNGQAFIKALRAAEG